jgi:hypothetical protein
VNDYCEEEAAVEAYFILGAAFLTPCLTLADRAERLPTLCRQMPSMERQHGILAIFYALRPASAIAASSEMPY